MTEVVASIRRVTDIMGEISAASSEQNQGVQQVGQAVVQMDQTTQQNAALVEEMAAAAASLRSQAQELVQVVSRFRLKHGDGGTTHPAPVTAPVRAPVRPKPATAPAPAPVRVAAKPAATAPTRPAKSAAVALASGSRQKAVSQPGGDDGDWETF